MLSSCSLNDHGSVFPPVVVEDVVTRCNRLEGHTRKKRCYCALSLRTCSSVLKSSEICLRMATVVIMKGRSSTGY